MIKRSLLLLLFSAVAAFPQLGEISVSLGTSRLSNAGLGADSPTSPQVEEKTNFRLGFRVTFNTQSHFGHELGYAYNRGSFNYQGVTYGMPIHQYGYNFLVYATPEGSSLRPFATGGVHFATFYPPGAQVFAGNGITKFGFNYGGGLKVKVSDSFLVRFDLRQYQQGKPDLGLVVGPSGLLRQLEVSAGLAFTF